jgi:hypothetical protein
MSLLVIGASLPLHNVLPEGTTNLYAITDKTVTATFVAGTGVKSLTYTSTGCTIRNSAT